MMKQIKIFPITLVFVSLISVPIKGFFDYFNNSSETSYFNLANPPNRNIFYAKNDEFERGEQPILHHHPPQPPLFNHLPSAEPINYQPNFLEQNDASIQAGFRGHLFQGSGLRDELCRQDHENAYKAIQKAQQKKFLEEQKKIAEKEKFERRICEKQNRYQQKIDLLLSEVDQKSSIPFEHKKQRKAALENVKKGINSVLPAHRISYEAQTFAQNCGINLRSLITMNRGQNAYEHQLYLEFLQLLEHGFELSKSHHKNSFVDFLGRGIALGIEAHHFNGNPEIATNWADFGWATLDLAKAAANGVIRGLYNTSNTLLHPIKTVENIIQSTGTIVTCLAKAIGSTFRFCYQLSQSENRLAEIEQLINQIQTLAAQAKNYLSKIPPSEYVEQTTTFAVEAILMGKIFSLAAGLCKHLKPLVVQSAKIFAREKYVIQRAAIAGFEEGIITQKVISQAQTHVGQNAPKITKSIRPLIKPWINVKKFQKKFDGRVFYEGKPVCLDYEHLFSITEKITTKRSGHVQQPRLHGWHHDFGNQLEKDGIVKYENVIYGNCGSFEAKPIVDGVQYDRKTFFSPHWSEEQVIEKILEAFQAPPILFEIDRNGCHKIMGKTHCNLMIKIIFDPIKSIITTAYPIFEEL